MPRGIPKNQSGRLVTMLQKELDLIVLQQRTARVKIQELQQEELRCSRRIQIISKTITEIGESIPKQRNEAQKQVAIGAQAR